MLGLGQEVKAKVVENKDEKMEEKGWLEDDLEFFYQEEEKDNPDSANFPYDVEGNFENYKKEIISTKSLTEERNLNRPGSDQMLVDPVEICVDNRTLLLGRLLGQGLSTHRIL